MAAFVVVSPPVARGRPRRGMRLSIFPGSATHSVFPARKPFWIGYGFVPEPGGELSSGTRFELEVDGEPYRMETETDVGSGGEPSSKQSIATFQDGLDPGWHRFSGRWYDGGQLVLTSDRSVEFVER
jgi:hypothetical protein